MTRVGQEKWRMETWSSVLSDARRRSGSETNAVLSSTSTMALLSRQDPFPSGGDPRSLKECVRRCVFRQFSSKCCAAPNSWDLNDMPLLDDALAGFNSVRATADQRNGAAEHLRRWLTDDEFAPYRPQLAWLIETQQWVGLLDRFYQILPFGTGGRRGAVGIGPNRMNLWTLAASVQGHCEYLKERFPGEGKLLVVLAYDVRQFEDQRKNYSPDLPNPALHLSSKKLAQHAAGVYVANDIRVAILPPDSPRFLATPELSFTLRQMHAHGGLNISASH